MARVELPIVALNTTTGLPVAGASVQVKFRSSGTNATWWTQETGGTSSTSAIVTDSAGRANGWLDRGAYNCVISGTGITTYTESWDAAPASDNAIDGLWLPDNVIIQRHLADNSVGSAEIIDGAVTTNEILDATIAAGDLSSGAKQLFPQLATPGARTLAFGSNSITGGWGVSSTVDVTVTHGLASAPSYVFLATTTGTNGTDIASAALKSAGATTMVVRLISHVGNLNFPGISFSWMAVI